jgi:hypothetical protein
VKLVLFQIERLAKLFHLYDRRPLEGTAEKAVLVAAAVEIVDAKFGRREDLS